MPDILVQVEGKDPIKGVQRIMGKPFRVDLKAPVEVGPHQELEVLPAKSPSPLNVIAAIGIADNLPYDIDTTVAVIKPKPDLKPTVPSDNETVALLKKPGDFYEDDKLKITYIGIKKEEKEEPEY